ncbi:MAG: hypothetical protein M3N18_07080 [Actinomycetota bacterium]|nr:hypothetical protein [Actinomycetota bacterium]
MEPGKFLLDEDALPGSWYDVVQVILFGLCGHGHFDLVGNLVTLEPPEGEIGRAVARILG